MLKSFSKFELHYYLNDASHAMDAYARNKCEFELLGILSEISEELGCDIRIASEALKEGGIKDIWTLSGKYNVQIMLVLTVLNIILSRFPVSDTDLDKLKKEEIRLSIEEKKLSIKKLKGEVAPGVLTDETIKPYVFAAETNLKVVTRRSNFYKTVINCHKVDSVGFSCLDEHNNPVSGENKILRNDFYKFVLHSNEMPTLTVDNAKIEIISPVLKEGDYKWKGNMGGEIITFSMADKYFKRDVLSKKVSFQYGSVIECVLKIHRKLNELGDVVPSAYTVETVLEKHDENSGGETMQGKRYRHNKKQLESQGDFFVDVSP